MRLRRGQLRRISILLCVVGVSIAVYSLSQHKHRRSKLWKAMMDFSKPRHGRISEKILKGSQANEPEKDFNRKDAFGLALSNVRKEHHRVTEVVEVMAKSIFHTHKENWARGKKDAVDKLDQEISQMLHMRNSKKRSRKRGKMNSLIQSTPTHAPTLSPTTDCNKPIVLWDTPMAGGNVNGFASEAISLLYPLSEVLDIRLYSTFYEEEFVDSLPHSVGERIHELHMKSLNRSLAPPDVIVSQWSPPELVQHMWNWQVVQRRPHRYVSRTMFEADGLPTGWESAIHNIDEVWVPSQWNKQVFAARGIDHKKIRVLHEGVDAQSYFNPDRYSRKRCRAQLLHKGERKTFVFLSVFKFETRKAWRELVSAFLDEFDDKDPVTLLLRTSPGDNMHLWRAFEHDVCKRRALQPHCFSARGPTAQRSIRLLPRMDTISYPYMYKAADAFVLPSHGEGWGRPILEAMAMALPVVSTNWSGPTEYLTAANAYPLPVTAFEPCEMEPQLQWATINVSALQVLLRRVYTDVADRTARGQRARQTVVHAYHSNNITHDVLELLQSACWHAHRDFARRHQPTKSVQDGAISIQGGTKSAQDGTDNTALLAGPEMTRGQDTPDKVDLGLAAGLHF